jgi:hypothetical protein
MALPGKGRSGVPSVVQKVEKDGGRLGGLYRAGVRKTQDSVEEHTHLPVHSTRPRVRGRSLY